MSKKSKRQSRKRSSVQTEMNKTTARKTSEFEFNPDYSQTIKDLKRIGILAGTFFTILVTLSFFLR
jgi:hypothetical protein